MRGSSLSRGLTLRGGLLSGCQAGSRSLLGSLASGGLLRGSLCRCSLRSRLTSGGHLLRRKFCCGSFLGGGFTRGLRGGLALGGRLCGAILRSLGHPRRNQRR